MQLAAACQEWAAAPESTQTETESPAAGSQPKRNLLRRLIDYLY
jgi:hypothetical protein